MRERGDMKGGHAQGARDMAHQIKWDITRPEKVPYALARFEGEEETDRGGPRFGHLGDEHKLTRCWRVAFGSFTEGVDPFEARICGILDCDHLALPACCRVAIRMAATRSFVGATTIAYVAAPDNRTPGSHLTEDVIVSSANRCHTPASGWVRAVMPGEAQHESAQRFLRRAIRSGVTLHAPLVLSIEVGAVITRRTHDQTRAKLIVGDMLAMRLVTLYPLDTPRMLQSLRMSVALELRGADAMYAALAASLAMPLISWDNEHLTRAAAAITVYTPDTAP